MLLSLIPLPLAWGTSVMLLGFREGRPPRIDGDACLAVGPPAVPCGACTSRCPTDSIVIAATGPSIGGSCIGCGRCAAVCPTAAIDYGATLPRPDPASPSSVMRVVCERASSCVPSQSALTVRCIGGVSVADWLEIVASAGGATVEVIDPGACATCPAGGVPEPWAESLASVSRRLSSAGLPRSLLPTVTPVTVRQREEAPVHGRRAFLRRLVTTRPNMAVPKQPRTRGGKRIAVNVAREAAAITTLRLDRHADVPDRAMPRAWVDPSCDGCGICAAVCPTPALALESIGEQRRRLTFTGSQCVACRRCAEVCPRDALAIEPHGGSGEQYTIRDFDLVICRGCDEPFVDALGARICSVCQRSQGLARSNYSELGASSSARALFGALSTRESAP